MSEATELIEHALQLYRSGKFEEAIKIYEKLLPSEMDNWQLLHFLGAAYLEIGNNNKASEAFDLSLSLNPNNPWALHFRGIALYRLNKLKDAIESYDKAVALNPDYAEAYHNRGVCLKDLNRLNEAVGSYEKAIALNPDLVDTYFCKSLAHLLAGEYLAGWELYEFRFKTANYIASNNLSFLKSAWRGDRQLLNKKILIYGEQGLGDFIQFCRYVPLVQSLGAEVILETPKRLTKIISSLKSCPTIVEKGAALPEVDVYCPVMSLPFAFRTTLQMIPAEIPYLFSDKNKVSVWKEKIGNSGKPRVGLVWSGGKAMSYDVSRSVGLKKLSPLFDLPVEYHSLQIEYSPEDRELLIGCPQINDHCNEQNDFSDTAALIECLDLVISVDTSIAHLAGALGKPVWVLLSFAPDFRWMLDRADSPWYPTARLFRQQEIEGWECVIDKVKEALLALISEKYGAAPDDRAAGAVCKPAL